jgi:hypothetical protein
LAKIVITKRTPGTRSNLKEVAELDVEELEDVDEDALRRHELPRDEERLPLLVRRQVRRGVGLGSS